MWSWLLKYLPTFIHSFVTFLAIYGKRQLCSIFTPGVWESPFSLICLISRQYQWGVTHKHPLSSFLTSRPFIQPSNSTGMEFIHLIQHHYMLTHLASHNSITYPSPSLYFLSLLALTLPFLCSLSTTTLHTLSPHTSHL